MLIHSAIEIYISSDMDYLTGHFFSSFLVLLYIGTTLALYIFNKYPSKVFVGDVFCYWSGMTFAASAITGKYTKTLLLFFIP